MYALFVLVIILSGFLVCTVAYIQIIKVIRTQLEIEHNRSKSNSLWETRFAAEKSEQNSRRASLKEKVENLEISENTCNNSDTLSRTPKSPREKRYKDSWTITMMIMIATGISFVGYILHFCAVIMKTTFRPETLDKIRPVYILIIRGYFLQSAIHPLIYCIVNKTFRKEGKTVYRKTINRLRSRKK
ncbi:unnamed protein product [Mytilus coruscus]|uniref:G-protein coupled receptors family 1 profile domain-containing protein n=1 Tax=Mytilus coruscus TaxID=42192 RepID=A0A6J8C9B0_MYTCO|nr:unnamed protein product [Mytilus coruscus]